MIPHEPTVYVVDDDEAIRNALRLLMKSANLKVHTCASAEEFLKTCRADTPGCLVLDVRMPGMSGLELQRVLNERHIAIPIIIMTGHGDIPMAVQAIKAGAMDFIEKPFKNEFLLERVQRSLARAVAAQKEQQEHSNAAARVASLTPREREVMDMLIQGKRNKIIASELGISNRTVEAHRAKIMEKMQAHSLSDVVRLTFEAEGGASSAP